MAYDGGDHGPTVSEIRKAGLGIRASCQCGHSRVVDLTRVCVSQSIDVHQVGDLLTCSRCRTKGMATIVAPLS